MPDGLQGANERSFTCTPLGGKKRKKYRGMDEEMKGTDHKMSRGVMELWR